MSDVSTVERTVKIRRSYVKVDRSDDNSNAETAALIGRLATGDLPRWERQWFYPRKLLLALCLCLIRHKPHAEWLPLILITCWSLWQKISRGCERKKERAAWPQKRRESVHTRARGEGNLQSEDTIKTATVKESIECTGRGHGDWSQQRLSGSYRQTCCMGHKPVEERGGGTSRTLISLGHWGLNLGFFICGHKISMQKSFICPDLGFLKSIPVMK